MEIELVLDRMEEDKAVFISKDKQEIIIPANLIDKSIEPGQTVWLEFSVDQNISEEKEDIAKKMLNEIISNQSS